MAQLESSSTERADLLRVLKLEPRKVQNMICGKLRTWIREYPSNREMTIYFDFAPRELANEIREHFANELATISE